MHSINPNRLFLPSQAIRKEKEFFAGRKEFILDAIEELETPGRSLVLYGERGVGKTSLGWQIFDILSEDKTLLKIWDLDDFQLENKYKCVWIQCEKNMVSIEGTILRSLLKSVEGPTFNDVFPRLFRDKQILDSSKRKYKIDFKVVGSEFEFIEKQSKNKEEITKALLDKKASIRALFSEIMYEIKNKYKDYEIIIFFDEIDVLPIKEGIGSLIKDTSSARFIIIGILENLDDITSDHPSVIRKIAPLPKIKGLSEPEINWILDRAENQYPRQLFFSNEFRRSIVEKAHGFPWLVQAFGHSAVKAAIKKSKSLSYVSVSEAHLQKSISKLIEPRTHERGYSSLLEILNSDQSLKIDILTIVSNSPSSGISIGEVLDKVEGQMKRWVEKNIKEMIKLGIFKIDMVEKISYQDPIARIIVQLHSESI